MAHECDEREKHDTVTPFSTFFDEGQTPPHLLAWGIYRDIAVAMQTGEHRAVLLAMLGLNLVHAMATGRAPRSTATSSQTSHESCA